MLAYPKPWLMGTALTDDEPAQMVWVVMREGTSLSKVNTITVLDEDTAHHVRRALATLDWVEWALHQAQSKRS